MYSTPEATSATICEVRDQRSIPYYRLHPGRNKFCCRGRGVHSHEMCVFYVSFLLILGVTALFFAFEVRLLRIKLSPVVGVFGGILFIYVMATFLRTAFMDPGILPRATKAEAEWVRMSIATGEVHVDGTGSSAGENTPAARTFTPGARTRQILIRGHHVKLNYCHSCKFFRPPRASHCSTCDNCVDRFDHHCPWVGNCVGRRNYRYFVLFIYSLSLYCVYILVFAIINLVFLYYENNDILEVVKASPGSLLEILITFFTMWTVFGLAGYHTSLSCREFSTHEDIRHFPRTLRQAGHENPFGRKNKCLNLSYVLCGPQPPSLLQAWRKVPEDSWPVGARGSVTDPSSMNETVIRMGGTDNAYAVPVPLPIIGPDQNDQNWRDVPGGYPRQQHPQSNVVVESI